MNIITIEPIHRPKASLAGAEVKTEAVDQGQQKH